MEQLFDIRQEKIKKTNSLRDEFIEPPFSVIDTKCGSWQNRKSRWKQLGIQSELGRNAVSINSGTDLYRKISEKAGYDNKDNYTSIFDPVLCEVLYHWFCPKNGHILDPFAGGSVRGIVANYLGYKYTGIDIKQDQIISNREQALKILPIDNQPNWYVGDSKEVLKNIIRQYDFIFSCPPYFNLEVYSDLKGDISNMSYSDFLIAYEEIIKQSCSLLKNGCFACFVVGEVRNKKGNYIGFVPDTIKIFQNIGMSFYNEAILLTPIASASMRARGNMKTNKLAKVHQNILVFKKH